MELNIYPYYCISLFKSTINRMKKIVLQLKDFITEDFEWKSYLWTFIFVASAITVNYTIGFENKILTNHASKVVVILRFFAYYFLAWFAIAVPKMMIKKKTQLFYSPQFWIKILLFLALISITSGFRFKNEWFSFINDPLMRIYIVKLTTQIKCLMIYTLPLIIMCKIFDKNQKGIYGLNLSFGNGTTYLKMLLIVAPLIIAASFTPDFLQAYPRYRAWQFENLIGLSSMLSTTIFEALYVLDFAMTEWMFRGALVIGMVAIMGKDAILPMVSVYVFLHFGKPMGETISAFFGGYILGVLAYTTRHIWGGVILHSGIALIMESMGLFQFYVMGMHR